MTTAMLTGGGDWERYTFRGACNEPVPFNWKNACRRWAGHPGAHHTWDPRTGTDKGRHPMPFSDPDVWERRIPAVDAWGSGARQHTRMLNRRAYVAPIATDRLMVAAIRAREPRPSPAEPPTGTDTGTPHLNPTVASQAASG